MSAYKSFLSLFFLVGFQAALANDFPTRDRVLFVHECMALHDGESYTNLYSCSCVVDRIAEEMSYDEYVEADSYTRMQNMRGERGGLFRGTETARSIREKFKEIKDKAEQSCFIRTVKN